MIRRLMTAIAAVGLIATGAVACSNGSTAYTPAAAAFGNAGLSQCYMPLSVPQTAWQAIEQQYIAQGWCHTGWTPLYIPQQTYMAYYPYYSSPTFYTHYIPVTYRTTYVSYEHSFGTRYHSQIVTAEKTATYKGSNGKTTTYNKISTGGGTRAKFGSGTRCDVIRDSLLKPQFRAPNRGGGGFGGGSRSGGGYSGGSRTSGGSRSGYTSGSHTGC